MPSQGGEHEGNTTGHLSGWSVEPGALPGRWIWSAYCNGEATYGSAEDQGTAERRARAAKAQLERRQRV